MAVVWPQWEGGRYRIMAVTYTLHDGWVGPSALDDGNGDSLNAQVAISADGSAVALWRQFDGSDYRIHASYRVARSRWGNPTILERQHDDSIYPRLAIDRSGKAIAIWVQRHCPQRHCVYSYVWSSRYDRHTRWSEPTRLSSHGFDVQIAIDNDTTAIAVWSEPRGLLGERSVILVNRYRPEAGWRQITALDVGGESSHPSIATLDGHTVIVWERFLSGRRQIWGVVP